MPGLIELMRALEEGAVTARALADLALAKASDPAGEGGRIFIALDAEWVRAAGRRG